MFFLGIRVAFYVALAILMAFVAYLGIKYKTWLAPLWFAAGNIFTAFAFEWFVDALFAAEYLTTAGGYTDSDRWSLQFITSFAVGGLLCVLYMCCTTAGIIATANTLRRGVNGKFSNS